MILFINFLSQNSFVLIKHNYVKKGLYKKTRDLWHEFFYICVEKPLLVLNDCLSYVPNTYTISYIAAQSQARIGRKMKLKSDVKKKSLEFSHFRHLWSSYSELRMNIQYLVLFIWNARISNIYFSIVIFT